MKRRDFIAVLSGAAAMPLMARAQQPAKLPTIGFLSGLTASGATPWVKAFVQRLAELGWIEGRTIAIEYRYLGGHSDRAAEVAAELVRVKVDVIVTHATELAFAAKNATSTIPIVFAVANDPVGTGLVATLSRPGGNITGLSLQQTDLAGKRLELLREASPGLRRLAVMSNPANLSHAPEVSEVRRAANKFGVDVVTTEIGRAEEISPAFDGLKGRVEAVYVLGDPLLATNRVHINSLALATRLMTMHSGRIFVESGGLMSYAPYFPDLFRRAGDYVDKILRGTSPAGIPVEQPTKFELVINLKTAKALGLDIPPTLFARADELID